MAWMGSMEGSCTGGTKRLGTFDKPPIIIFEWDDLTYTWFYRPHPTRHLAESLVGAGVPVVIVQRPQHGGEKGDVRELEQVQFGIWCCSPWYDRKSTRLNSSHVKISYAVFFLIKKNNN